MAGGRLAMRCHRSRPVVMPGAMNPEFVEKAAVAGYTLPMPSYVDGFVLPIPRKNVAEYKKIARKAGAIWMACGALSYHECMADDVAMGKVTSFPRSVKLKKTEVVWFSWIEYKSRRHRDQVNALVMEHPQMLKLIAKTKGMPFDTKRMIWGGFKTMVAL